MTKPTLATLKSFIRREVKNHNLYVNQKSSFDGMVDCVMPTEGGWSKVEKIDETNKNTLGIRGLWLVNQSRDLISPYADENYIGYEVYNCCGSSLIAIKRLC